MTTQPPPPNEQRRHIDNIQNGTLTGPWMHEMFSITRDREKLCVLISWACTNQGVMGVGPEAAGAGRTATAAVETKVKRTHLSPAGDSRSALGPRRWVKGCSSQLCLCKKTWKQPTCSRALGRKVHHAPVCAYPHVQEVVRGTR